MFSEWSCSTFVLPANQRFVQTTPLFSGIVPTKTVYIITTIPQATGSYDTNPNLFQHHQLKRFCQKISGIACPVPEIRYDDWTNYQIPYRIFCDHVGHSLTNRSNSVEYDKYGTRRFMIVYSNSPMGISASIDPNRERVQRGVSRPFSPPTTTFIFSLFSPG